MAFEIENGVLVKYEEEPGVTEVVIPEGVTEIGDWAFSYCKSLTSITLPESVTKIGDSAFHGCESLTSITLPESVTKIGGWAFSYCKSLTSITLPESVTEIGNSAFSGCKSLTSVTLPEGITKIGNMAFSGCKNLADKDGFVIVKGILFNYYGDRADVTIPASVTKIGWHAFYGCKSLTNLTLPDSLEDISSCDFYDIPGLESITLGAKIKDLDLEAFKDANDEISWYGYFCYNKKEIESIDWCRNLKEIRISPQNKYLCSEGCVVFSKDKKRLVQYKSTGSSYTVPDGVKSIGNGAFGCSFRLETLILPESLESISADAIRYTCLEYVKLPAGVKKLAKKGVDVPYVAFYDPEFAEKVHYSVYLGGGIDDLPVKARNGAVKGFFFAREHGITEIEPFCESYTAYIRNNIKTYIKEIPENETILRFMLEEKLLSKKDFQKVFAKAAEIGKPEITALLLDYKNKNLAEEDSAAAFSLEKDDPALRRREEIKNQKGIRGIVFVKTGSMKNFGSIDEYTGAQNFSDLKQYIEERGGFFRSAISSKTDYLICNDPDFATSKLKEAKERGIPVISEDEFLEMCKES